MGKVIPVDFGYCVTETIATCADCEQSEWIILLSNVDTGEPEFKGTQKIVGYECLACGWRVNIKYPIALIK